MTNRPSAFFAACLLLLLSACTPVADLREPFLGNWSVRENCNVDGSFTFALRIEKIGASGNEVRLANVDFYNLPYSPTALVSGSRIDLPTQKYFVRTVPELSYEFTGTGLLQGDSLTIHYDVYRWEETPLGMDIRALDECTLIGTR
jgi:hypothetical protein